MNTIFKDLATLVHEQGEVIDSIEANVESTHVRVQEGTEQLRQAETYKVKKSNSLNSILVFFNLFHICCYYLYHHHSALEMEKLSNDMYVLKARYFQKTDHIIFLPFSQTFLNV